MERFVVGEIVVIPFPFSDLSSSKKRPALVLSQIQGDDIILCQITTANRLDKYIIDLEQKDFSKGNLKIKSIIRPNRIFTADKSLIKYKIGKINSEKINEVKQKITEIFDL
ncbi:type II toxin-antitoxin system PemK/MazF family toxin [archaeon]|nr:type II toxin-antitoxin system PemK/MazF family toxin [Candidatus Woesearchaeota archaeon]MBT3463366.1 type II toxin-antitoxin system PemK/MazF family toxin [archaeon]MBT4352037.1 type II toxin-antitoxin system PemK/MazF family toxin [archaeon]MBT4648021.1 type II toxin-antitoxin system PemK/MazF family toxin [archaeon]MBT7392364.1 type II toxin-antitoxin system PemK/MazF family toxin [archaeon]